MRKIQTGFLLAGFALGLTACQTKNSQAGNDQANGPAPASSAAAVQSQTESESNSGAQSAPTACLDLSRGEPRMLSGRLLFGIAPGAPNYTDVQKGDSPEPIYVLQLDHDICLTGDDMADPEDRFNEVQVVPGQVPESALKAMINHTVRLGLYNAMPAQTGHHHRPLVAWVDAVEPAGAAGSVDPTAEMGTGATTIRAFYAALHAGQGDTAAQMIVPEKRGSGPYAAPALSAFYGAMREPVELGEVSAMSADTWNVHYHYATGSKVCDGRAIIETSMRAGRTYIARIHALDGC